MKTYLYVYYVWETLDKSEGGDGISKVENFKTLQKPIRKLPVAYFNNTEELTASLVEEGFEADDITAIVAEAEMYMKRG